tara:strand:+ start:56 stop:691 length:636 start_codon:yes stop_codon:yes gene_type:complete
LRKRPLHSNWGIDLMAEDYFKNKKNGFFIDVGCHQPLLNNNTYILYKKGWRGINIDLDFGAIDMFNFFRKDDTNIQAAISNSVGNKNLYFFHNRSAINTLSQTAENKAREIREVKTFTLNDIIKNSQFKNKEIDFLSVDVEGTEIEVLQGLDFNKYKPKLVVLEFIDFNVSEYYNLKIDNILNSSINKYMENQNYKLVNWIHDDLVYVPNN